MTSQLMDISRKSCGGAWWALVLSVLITVSTGCGETPSASFRLNMVEATKQRLTSVQEQQVATILLAMFGTPDEPHCLPESGLDEAKLRLQDGPGSLTKKVEKMKKLGRLNTKKELPGGMEDDIN